MQQAENAFKPSFLPPFLVTFLLGCVVLAGATLSVHGDLVALDTIAFLRLGGIFAGATALSLLVTLFRIRVSLQGIRGHDAWGRSLTLEWKSIVAARPLNFLGIKFLRLNARHTIKTLWLPLFLNDMFKFSRLVHDYVGAKHVLTSYLKKYLEAR